MKVVDLQWARIPRVGADQLLDVCSREGDPTTALDNAQLRTVLNAAIDRLPTEYQMAVRLFYWFQVPIAEIAEQLRTPENSIKSYLHRARKLLASDLMRQKHVL